MPRAGVVSLGCSRNLVDSEIILGSLKKAGYKIAEPEDGVDVCVVNTCAFVKDAREESVNAILEAVRLKKKGKVKRLVICGCLPQLYKAKLFKEIREADLVLGTSDFPNIASLVDGLKGRKKRLSEISSKLHYIYDDRSPRSSLTSKHYAYVKIAEGCSNFCSYCIISKLRGAFRSRAIDSIIQEIKDLSGRGALKEVNLVGQDTTMFGADRYGRPMLPELFRRICALKNNISWVRLLYTHPAHYTDELIDTIRTEEKICKYLDLPIQHISDSILKKMNRRTARKDIVNLIGRLRKRIPGISLRTSIIVGFPGETERDFKELLRFLNDTEFEKLGAFIYSKEDGTAASRFGAAVPEKIKKDRYDELMKLQQDISMRINRRYIGKRLDVLIEEKVEKGVFLGRTEYDAPEVDGAIYVSGNGLKAGEFCKVKVTDALEYDLIGERA